MKYLFVHQNFPGQYLHLIRHIITDPANEVVFISEPNPNQIAGVRKILYQPPKPNQERVHQILREFDLGARRAELVAAVARNLKRLGFKPDIIIGHHGWGELLNLTDVWPDVPILGYFEFYYRTNGQDVDFDSEFPITDDRFPRIRAMNIINLLAVDLEQHGQTPTEWQYTRYPDWTRRNIRIIKEGAQLDICRPDPEARSQPFSIGEFVVKPKDKLVTYVARNLEPYRGFHVIMRALPDLLAARPDLKVVLVGGDDVSYGMRLARGTWREHMLKELAGKFDTSRVLMPGQIPYVQYVKLLQRSDTHVYLTYPFVASWSLREALAIGCPVIGSQVDPVGEFITHGSNGLLVPCLDHKNLAQTILKLLEDTKLNRKLRTNARKYAEEHLDMRSYISAMDWTIRQIVGA